MARCVSVPACRSLDQSIFLLQTDEEELGFSYDFIELYTGYYLPMSDQKKAAFTASLAPEAKGQFEAWAEMCSAVHRRNAHKLTSPHNINIL